MRKTNYIIISTITIFSFMIFLHEIITKGFLIASGKLLIIPIILIPSFIRKFFKKKFNYTISAILIIFTFFTYYIGYKLKLYDIIWGYDKLIHFSSGIVSGLIALYILYKTKNLNKNIWFNILFTTSFAILSSCTWEFQEFFVDKVFKHDEQSVKASGVDDTMYDIIVSLIGITLLNKLYYIEHKTQKRFLIGKYIDHIKEE